MDSSKMLDHPDKPGDDWAPIDSPRLIAKVT
jgi:hypothetical protein